MAKLLRRASTFSQRVAYMGCNTGWSPEPVDIREHDHSYIKYHCYEFTNAITDVSVTSNSSPIKMKTFPR
jgi:hypothetical protein